MDMEMCQDVVEGGDSSFASDSDCDWQCTIDNIFSDFKNPEGRGQLFSRPDKFSDISPKELSNVFSIVPLHTVRSDVSQREKSMLKIALTPLLQSINEVLSSIEGVVEDEKEFFASISKLNSHLDMCRSVALLSVRKFTESTAFTGFYVALDIMKFSSAQLVQALGLVETVALTNKGPNITIDKYLPQVIQIHTAFCSQLDTFLPTMRRFHFIIRYARPLCELYDALMDSDPDFSRFMGKLELVAEANLTYMIRVPVRQISRYEQHCRQIYDNILACKAVCDEEYWEIFCSMEARAERILKDVRSEMVKCFNEVNLYRDLEQLHALYARYASAGVGFDMGSVVNPKRIIVRVGKLRRHHRHIRRQRTTDGSFRYSIIHVFSDLLLVSAEVSAAADLPPQASETDSPDATSSAVLEYSENMAGITHRPFSSPATYRPLTHTLPTASHSHDVPASGSSVPESTNTGLRLQCIVPLFKGSGTVCMALPSMLSNTESSWFLVLSKRKALYLCANSVTERDEWVKDINRVLTLNSADNDTYRTKTRAALVNTLLGEFQNHAYSQRKRSKDKSDDAGSGSVSGSASPSHAQQSRNSKGLSPHEWIEVKEKNVYLLQPRWWHMYDVLIDILKNNRDRESGGDNSLSSNGISHEEKQQATQKTCSNLRNVIDFHAEEVYESILAVCDSEASRVCLSNALLNCNSGWVSSITTNPHTQHLVAVGWFFQQSGVRPSGPGGAEEDTIRTATWSGNRPTILQVFLFSHVLLVMEVNCSPNGIAEFELSYLYHIELRHLQCKHYEWSSEKRSSSPSDPGASSSMMLIDTSPSNRRRTLTNLLSTNTPRLRKVIYAPTSQGKVSWMKLINETVSAYKTHAETGAFEGNIAEQLLKYTQLYRVCAPAGLNGLWQTEEPGERVAAGKSHRSKR